MSHKISNTPWQPPQVVEKPPQGGRCLKCDGLLRWEGCEAPGLFLPVWVCMNCGGADLSESRDGGTHMTCWDNPYLLTFLFAMCGLCFLLGFGYGYIHGQDRRKLK